MPKDSNNAVNSTQEDRTMKARLVLLTILALVVAFAVACATVPVPQQVRPVTPDPFVGKWEGMWTSRTTGNSGSLNTRIDSPDETRQVRVHTTLTNAVVPSFSITTKFVNGELIHSSTTLEMTFRLHGDQLVAEYDNKRINDNGTWHLKRKK